MDNKLYVGNLSYATTDDELRQLFGQAGTVASVEVIKDRDTGRSKGFGFVEMSSQADAENAIKMFNGYTMGNRPLKVSIARPREERPRGGGWYEDRGSGGGGGGRSGGNRDRDRGGNRDKGRRF